MMRFRYNIFLLLCCVLMSMASCVQESFPEGNGLTGGEGWLYIPFNAEANVEVSTKATLDYSYENTIRNIYIFIFDASGNKIYGNWLTEDHIMSNETAVRNSDTDSWWVSNASSEGQFTTGGLKVKCSAGEGFKVYLMTNLDADMVKVSSDLLAHNIDSEQDLKDFKVYMNVESVNRNGQFPMTGMIDNVTISEQSVADMNDRNNPLKLRRLDAKIRFIFMKGDRPDENGQRITGFTAKQWRVINVPTTSYAIQRADDSREVAPGDVDYAANAPYFFDTPWRNFEDFPSETQSSFSFYMLENRQTPKNTAFTSYNDRSRQIKNQYGLNQNVSVEYHNYLGQTVTKDFRKFSNANDFSTYVLVTGRVDMELENDDAGQTLGADVQYLIHLGNWNFSSQGSTWADDRYTGVTNYDTERNHSYTYTVTVNSVNNIRVEVESSRDNLEGDIENQPGAVGDVVIAKEEIALCDAHYESRTMSFHASNFLVLGEDGRYRSNADKLTWKVKTPFCDGAPIIEEGVDIADHLDYKWVTFRLNKKDDSNNYTDKRRKFTDKVFETKEFIQDNKENDGTDGLTGYHNDGCMDIIALVKYIKKQADLYADYQNALRTNQSAVNGSDFDAGTVDPLGPKISVTVFINEYYYDEHPITHQVDPTLWKRFVNQNDRTMHILCDSNSSTDMESSATGSVITIQQKAIKTIYNTQLDYTELTTAWGTESVQEYSSVKTYNKDADTFTDSGKNTDLENGRANSVFEWGIAPDNVTTSTITVIKENQNWSTYINDEVDNATPQLRDEYKALRYICMTKNRDNNGDGKITRDEIRWYTASIRQLNGLFVGNSLLDPSSRLYNRSAAQQQSNVFADWTQLVVSSTDNGTKSSNHNKTNDGPRIIFAHEGLSTSSYYQVNNEWGSWNTLREYGVRCVRNLGTDKDAYLNEMPQNYIEHEELTDADTGNKYHMFTCTHLNYASLRDYTSGELTFGDERSPQNQLYKKFVTAPTYNTFNSVNFTTFNSNIDSNNKSSVQAGYCPVGYRVPSQIELTMMRVYGGNESFNMHARTYWSFGTLGTNQKQNHAGFTLFSSGNMTIDGGYVTNVRCVKDIRVE